MLNNIKNHQILWTVTLILTILTALTGIFIPHIYDNISAPAYLAGALPQDILTVILSILALYGVLKVQENSLKISILILGFLGSLFYLYGIFVIERVYNIFYPLYLGIFSLSFWSIIYAILSLQKDKTKEIILPRFITIISASFAIFIATIFSILWLAALYPLITTHNRIEFLYSIYILDLAFIMPAFFITGIQTLRQKPLGIIFLPFVYIIGFFVIFPLGLCEIAKPFYGQTTDLSSMIISFAFSALMLTIGLIHLQSISQPITSSTKAIPSKEQHQ